MRYKSILLAALLVLSLPVAVMGVGAQSDVYTADTNHGLTDDAAVATYDAEGVVTGNVSGLDMQVTIADKVGDLNKSEWAYASSARTFIKVEYTEEISRTVRVYIPNDYFRPRVKAGLSPLESGPPASLEPVSDREYTAVTIEMDGTTRAIYPVAASRGIISSGRASASGLLENSTGFEIPSLSSRDAAWQHVDDAALTETEATHRIPSNETDIEIQYDKDESPGSERWITVRPCEKSDQPVCTFQRDGSNQTYLLSTTETVPPVRWKEEPTATDTFHTTVNDVMDAFAGLGDGLGNLLGGG